MAWTALDSSRGFGMPQGCRLELPIRSAPLAPGRVRFMAAKSTLDELALAIGSEANDTVARRGIVGLETGKVRDLPWEELERPPLVDRSSSGWVAAFTRGAESGVRSALFWHESSGVREIAQGDGLELADVACNRDQCAALTTLARPTRAPGATLLYGDGRGSLSRIDLEADPAKPWRPLAITRLEGERKSVALALPDSVALWDIQGDRATKRHELSTPHGVYDVLHGDPPLFVGPGADASQPCKEDAFPLLALRPEQKEQRFAGQAAPESLIARPLTSGSILVWVAPVSCRMASRTVVHAMLLRADGAPASSPMSVTDALGFAVATRGEQVSLWLYTEQGLTWLRARCTPALADAAP
jgi:hypothetical protein